MKFTKEEMLTAYIMCHDALAKLVSNPNSITIEHRRWVDEQVSTIESLRSKLSVGLTQSSQQSSVAMTDIQVEPSKVHQWLDNQKRILSERFKLDEQELSTVQTSVSDYDKVSSFPEILEAGDNAKDMAFAKAMKTWLSRKP
jgi:hypothetical protein